MTGHMKRSARRQATPPRKAGASSRTPQNGKACGLRAYDCRCMVWVYLPLIEINSTSKIRVALGPMSPPAPRVPYPSDGGMKNCYFDPTGMSCTPSVQPLIT